MNRYMLCEIDIINRDKEAEYIQIIRADNYSSVNKNKLKMILNSLIT